MVRMLVVALMAVIVVWWVVCERAQQQKAVETQTPEGFSTFGFMPAPGFFAERDVQYIDSTPHCIVRLSRAANPGGAAAYLEVVMEWCEGVS